MSKNQSNLTPTGFDYVVAVTQDSINAALEEYLYKGLPEAILCYVYDSSNNPAAIDYKTFVKNANNTDPFSVPDTTPSSDPRIQNLNNANFAFAIKAKLGLPPGVAPSKLPPIVALKAGQSNVTYTLMFSEFVAAEIIFGPRGSITWFNQSQPSGTSWSFSGAVDLNFQDASFTNLPPNVQNQIKGIGQPAMFSPQQLYYDLNSSDLEQGFQFNNVPSNSALNTFMTADFINTYWKALGGKEVLGYGAKQVSGLSSANIAVTNLNFFTPDAVGNEGAPLTLNYLCAANNDPLPDTTHAGFGWNWIEPSEAAQYDGVAALNRNAFVRYLTAALFPYVASNCYAPWVRVTYIGGIELKVKYEFNMTPGQSPTLNPTPTGATILSYGYNSGVASDQAGLNGDAGKMELSSSYNLTVTVSGNTMTIVQHLVIWTYARYLATGDGGNVVDKQITDVYSFGVDDEGHIVASAPQSTVVDNSQRPGANGFLNFWADVQTLSDKVTQWAQSFYGTRLTDIPVSAVRNFVFPGGATFSFSDVAFSDNQDLVSHITYADPS
jgi:hypothetical protein